MIFMFSAAVAAASMQAAAPTDSCAAQQNCVHATPAQLFAVADQLFNDGDLAGAEHVLEALTQVTQPELRAEARFRLAAVREKLGDLRGAAQSLRDLLAEQPKVNRARLELARILSLLGETKAAKAQIAAAERMGLPPEVEQNVKHFAGSLRTDKTRGLTVELTAGPDSNVNRSTSSGFIDTIITPFELDADARRQSALGYTLSLHGYSRDTIAGATFLSNAGMRADLSTKPRFNDVQLALDSGPQVRIGHSRARFAGLYQRRWFGGDLFSIGIGGEAELLAPIGAKAQLDLTASRVRQTVEKNSGQDGWLTALNFDLTRPLGAGVTGRITLRYGALDARVRAESLRQQGAGLLLVRPSHAITLFAEADYTRTRGLEPLFLFGKARHDHRWDFTGGAIVDRVKIAGFSPLLRVTHTESAANIVLFQYRRTRFDVGITRSF
jgi:tetratricopeptide (TPR) repeat protein